MNRKPNASGRVQATIIEETDMAARRQVRERYPLRERPENGESPHAAIPDAKGMPRLLRPRKLHADRELQTYMDRHTLHSSESADSDSSDAAGSSRPFEELRMVERTASDVEEEEQISHLFGMLQITNDNVHVSRGLW
jgi:hypothetical protein